MPEIKKTVNYRRCEANVKDGASFSLQSCLEKAKDTVAMPWKRPVAGINSNQFLQWLVSKQGCICGVLAHSEKNKKISLCDSEADGSTWQGHALPKDANGKLRELEEGCLIFAIRENHVAMIPSKDITIRDFLGFLTWFIQSKAEIATDASFDLVNIPSATAFKKLKDQTIKGFSIGKNALNITQEKMPGEEGKRSKMVKHVKVDSLVMGLLKGIGLNTEVLGELEKSSDPGNIYLRMDISYRSRSQKDSQEVMHALVNSIGDNPDLDTRVKLSNNTSIKNDELTVKGDVKLQISDGIISKDEAMTALALWLTGAIAKHTVYS
ncbi:MAG: hypothetical protein SFY80_10135 [Verrucomicrobiota bacterium]|nr:hypothetical protein [Verrucomicrobiota bacterium]